MLILRLDRPLATETLTGIKLGDGVLWSFLVFRDCTTVVSSEFRGPSSVTDATLEQTICGRSSDNPTTVDRKLLPYELECAIADLSATACVIDAAL